MNAIILICVTAAIAFQSVAKKQYNVATLGKGAYIFNSLTTFTAAIFFIFTDKGGFQFTSALIPYILSFAVCYGSAVLFSFLAIREGFMSLTSLATSYSLIIPTIYGLVFLGEKAGALLIIGIVFLLCSLFLVNAKKGNSGITAKWLLFALLAFFGNGLCSTVQTAQQKAFLGEYKSEFMIIALLILAVFFGILAFINERKDFKICIKKNWITLLNGAANGFTNMFIMVLVSRGMSASIMFPVISGGGLILTCLISIFIYKEKLTLKQYIGLALGTASVILMNI